MDPEQTLRDCAAHLRAGALDEAAEALAAYWGWRGQGGFGLPDGDQRARDLARRLAGGQAHDDPDAG